MEYAFKGTCNRKYGVNNWLKGTRSVSNNYESSGNSVIVHCFGDKIPDLPNYKFELLKLFK